MVGFGLPHGVGVSFTSSGRLRVSLWFLKSLFWGCKVCFWPGQFSMHLGLVLGLFSGGGSRVGLGFLGDVFIGFLGSIEGMLNLDFGQVYGLVWNGLGLFSDWFLVCLKFH